MDKGAHLDTIPGRLPFDRSLRFKAKYENEHLPMNLDSNWTQPALVQRFYLQLVVTTILTPALSSKEREQWLPCFGKYQRLDLRGSPSQNQTCLRSG
jgi:hypothetical protein